MKAFPISISDKLPTRNFVPVAPALAVGFLEAVLVAPDGGIASLTLEEASRRVREEPVLLVQARAVARRLGLGVFPAYDLLELFAFARPAEFCVPTPRGLAQALGLKIPGNRAEEAAVLHEAARVLLNEIRGQAGQTNNAGHTSGIQSIAAQMGRGGWLWADAVLAASGEGKAGESKAGEEIGLAVWRRLPEWQEQGAEPPPGNEPVEPAAARRRLAELVGKGAEARPQQADYADAVTPAFAPREVADQPNVVLAEAGTGVGKTLGYIAPASLWAEQNAGAVWIATFTRNLQNQIDQELDRLYPDRAVKERFVVLRKGRENYLCLLNYEEAVAGLTLRPAEGVALGLTARWLTATNEGDIVSGDFPGWLSDLVGRGRSFGLTDRRGECIYSACPHYRKCFIERGIRKARRARLVVANHALVMIQAALGGLGDGQLPTRYVFDEGHHLFNAADSAFSLCLSGMETAELRRWILGSETSKGRARGLRRRIEELIAGDERAEAALSSALIAARALPGMGWRERLAENQPLHAAESFLALIRQQVHARAGDVGAGYSLETEARPPVEGLLQAALGFEAALALLAAPLGNLVRSLEERLDDEAADLDTGTRLRIEAMIRGLRRRGEVQIAGWRRMLKELAVPQPPEFVDWLSVERINGQEADIGMNRHWIDPTRPFTEAVVKPAHGVIITSATLTDSRSKDWEVRDWEVAEARTGVRHLERAAWRARVPSPFDYAAKTRVFIVNDVSRTDPAQIAAAYRELFLAAGGGALGLFTAISRLKSVHERIAQPLEAAGLALLAQHVDAMSLPTLIDIFREEENSCLLGTDAVRDGVDVPGRSLRLIVFDRVPWPRPDILHKARKAAFGGADYDDMLTRLRLKQAFGRLVRREGDTGVFVLLDRALPSRLLGAFPEGVAVERLGLGQAVARTAAFLDAKPEIT